MKLKSTLAIACVASFAIFAESCKSDEAKKTVSGCKILSATETVDGNVEVETFAYNSSGQLTLVTLAINGGTPGSFSYVYNSDGKLTNVNSGDLNSTISYGTNGKVSQTVATDADGKAYGKEVYTYNASGQVTQHDSYGTQNDDPTLIRILYYTYTYANTTATDPLTRTTFLDNNGTTQQTITETYTYDDKKAATTDPTSASSHNVVKTVVSDGSGVENTTTTVFEYNEEGYPTKATENSTGNDSTPATSSVTVASYSCE